MSTSTPSRTIAVVNQKGGTAKTTTAVNLSVALTELGKRVVLIDLDPQASATLWLGHAPTPDLLEARSGQAVVATPGLTWGERPYADQRIGQVFTCPGQAR